MENTQSRNPNITNSTSSDMENTHSVFDVKVTIRGTLHTLTSIKDLLGYKIGNNNFEFDRQEFCLITGFAFGKIPKVDIFKGLQNSPFCNRVFPNKIAKKFKKVRVSDLLELIRKPKMWSALSDEDSVKVCLLLVSNIVLMGRESKNYIADNLIELVDDLSAWDAYPWGEYFWRALYRRLVNVISRHKEAVKLKNKKNVSRTKNTKKIDSSKKIETYNVYGLVWSLKIYILEMYRNNKFWWKKDPLVIPRGLAWSKIDGQPNDPITASPQGIQLNICDVVVHDPQFERQSKQVVDSVPVSTSDELVVEYHSITIIVQLIENVGDGDPSIVLKELAAVKQRMNPDSAISDVFIGEISCENLVQEQLQSRDMCIQSIGNQFVQHPLESPNGKRPEISISYVFNGEEYDKNVYESGDGKVSESEIINVLTGEVLCDKCVGGFYDGESSKLYYTDPKEYSSSSMTQLLQAAVPEQTSSQMLVYTPVDLNLPNLNESFTESQVNEYAGFDFDNTDNDSLSDMVKTGEEEIHLDGLEIVDDPFVQTPVKQNSEVMQGYD
ncbi:phospholipase-like protein [Tanacetum coccineum]